MNIKKTKMKNGCVCEGKGPCQCVVEEPQQNEQVNHPSHYGGKDNPYEAIKVIDAWGLGFSLGNTVKYISRAGKKDSKKELEDLKKALWYLENHIKNLEDNGMES